MWTAKQFILVQTSVDQFHILTVRTGYSHVLVNQIVVDAQLKPVNLTQLLLEPRLN